MIPVVSIIIPMYESEATIAETIDSLRAQSLADWETIVIDDGSRDSGPSIVRRYSARDDRLRMVHQPNAGLAAARNTGLDHATGQFVYFLDADDWVTPRGIEMLVRAASDHGGAAFGAYHCRGAGGEDLSVTCWPFAANVGLNELIEHNRFASHAHILDRRLLVGHRFDESLRVAEDYDMWLRLAESGVRWHAIDEVVAEYRVRPASLSKDFGSMNETTSRVVRAVHQRTLSGNTSGVVTSRAREQKAVQAITLEYWTMEVVSRDEPCEHLLCECSGSREGHVVIEPEAAASAAFWAVVFALGLYPDASAPPARSWLTRLVSAWDVIERSAAAAPGFRDAAIQALSRALVSPERIASSMLRRTDNRRAVVIGFGKNGRAIAREAMRLGRSIVIRDDDPSAVCAAAECGRGVVLVEPMNAPLHPDDTVVLSPSDCGMLRTRFPGRQTIEWSEVRRELAHDELIAIHAALAAPRTPAVCGAASSGGPSRSMDHVNHPLTTRSQPISRSERRSDE